MIRMPSSLTFNESETVERDPNNIISFDIKSVLTNDSFWREAINSYGDPDARAPSRKAET